MVGHPPEGLAVALEGDVVDKGAVEVVRHLRAELAQLLARADAHDLAVVGAPDRQRRAPVALARQRPVDVVLEPLAEAPVLDVLGTPVNRLVGGEQLVLDLGRADVPAGLGVVDERRVAAPAVRVGVLVLAGAEEPPGLAQRLDDVGVGLAHVHPRERAGALVEAAVGLDGVVDREPVLRGEPEVVLAEGGPGMHHAGAVLDRDEVAREHRVAALAVVADVREGWLVAQPEERRAGHRLLDLGLVAEDALEERLGEDQAIAVVVRRASGSAGGEGSRYSSADVGDLGIDGDRRVRHQRPGHRGPGEQRDARVVEQRELDVDGRIDRVLVALRHLVARERGAAARAVGDHPVALGEQALRPDLLERPPDGFDVLVRERVVGVVRVDPEADPLGQVVPLIDVAQHRLAALRVELGDAVALDVVLRGEAELPLDLELDREAVAVPAALARDEVPGHRAVAGEDVLEDPGQHVVRARSPVGRGRSLVELERRRSLAAADRLAEDIALTPAREHLLLELGERLGAVHGTVAGHRAVDSRYRSLSLPGRLFSGFGLRQPRRAGEGVGDSGRPGPLSANDLRPILGLAESLSAWPGPRARSRRRRRISRALGPNDLRSGPCAAAGRTGAP